LRFSLLDLFPHASADGVFGIDRLILGRFSFLALREQDRAAFHALNGTDADFDHPAANLESESSPGACTSPCAV
jgi:hypothetical protein